MSQIHITDHQRELQRLRAELQAWADEVKINPNTPCPPDLWPKIQALQRLIKRSHQGKDHAQE